MGYTYRHCGAPEDVIFTEALFQGAPGDPAAIAAEMDEITEAREATPADQEPTGGSTFKNPPGHKAWQLIDAAGCRGLIVGGAQVSEMHCNFLINLGGATAADIETLGETVRRRVKENSGVELEWEIKRIGVRPDSARARACRFASVRVGYSRIRRFRFRNLPLSHFCHGLDSFAVQLPARADSPLARQRVSLKSDSRSGSDAQRRSDPGRRRRARRGLRPRLRWRARASACACSSRRRSSAPSATASSSARMCFRCSTGSASPTRCWRKADLPAAVLMVDSVDGGVIVTHSDRRLVSSALQASLHHRSTASTCTTSCSMPAKGKPNIELVPTTGAGVFRGSRRSRRAATPRTAALRRRGADRRRRLALVHPRSRCSATASRARSATSRTAPSCRWPT